MSSWVELCCSAGAPSLLPVHRAMASSVRVNLPLPPFAEAHEKTDPSGPKKPLIARTKAAVFTGVPAGMLLAGPPELAAGLLQKAIDERPPSSGGFSQHL
ncbi:hypothetical protein E2562_003232 [Oryza meyeriana var. granulata]|uniref:Uncharacterized protein n=1 Tax=Oryza meyeriana var. granulata TaxID=110450 RepID=A0A6G1EUV6_9ORYZ|nr:hypothetical protein E2562_003232 [Oryza meyeriana var. granulata]